LFGKLIFFTKTAEYIQEDVTNFSNNLPSYFEGLFSP